MAGFRKAYFQASSWCAVLLALLISSATAQQSQILLGDTNVERSTDSNSAGTAEAFPVKAVATGQVSSLSVYLDRSNVATTISAGMYADRNGHPGALLTQGAASNAVSGGWNPINVSPVPVTSGTTYWLALAGVNGAVRFRDRTGSCRSEVNSQTNLNSLPVTWSTGSVWSTCIASMFESGAVAPGSSNPVPSTGLLVSPSAISLLSGHQQQFTAALNGSSDSAVTWSTSGGTISRTGLYTAPSSVGSYTVTARAVNSRRRVATAVVTVTSSTPTPPPVATAISISPSVSNLKTGTTQQFTAVVTGATNTAVTWSASSGTITSSGLYTAPASSGSYTITATSQADSSQRASAVVVVSAATQTVAVTISPAKPSVQASGRLQLTATVSGTANTNVTWAVTKGSGVITQSGLYTAPKSAESDTVTATSQSDTTKSANVSIAVTATPPAVSHSVSLQWDASTSKVAYYKVYRGTVSGGPYNLLSTNITGTSYSDFTVQPGTTYYYVTTALDSAGVESVVSNQFSAAIPSP